MDVTRAMLRAWFFAQQSWGYVSRCFQEQDKDPRKTSQGPVVLGVKSILMFELPLASVMGVSVCTLDQFLCIPKVDGDLPSLESRDGPCAGCVIWSHVNGARISLF